MQVLLLCLPLSLSLSLSLRSACMKRKKEGREIWAFSLSRSVFSSSSSSSDKLLTETQKKPWKEEEEESLCLSRHQKISFSSRKACDHSSILPSPFIFSPPSSSSPLWKEEGGKKSQCSKTREGEKEEERKKEKKTNKKYEYLPNYKINECVGRKNVCCCLFTLSLSLSSWTDRWI